jgi:hypothetical protein
MSKGTTKAIEALRAGLPITFDPAKSKLRGAKIDAIIDFARRINDWPLLETAVDEKIEEQAQFFEWWKANLNPHGDFKRVQDRRSRILEENG